MSPAAPPIPHGSCPPVKTAASAAQSVPSRQVNCDAVGFLAQMVLHACVPVAWGAPQVLAFASQRAWQLRATLASGSDFDESLQPPSAAARTTATNIVGTFIVLAPGQVEPFKIAVMGHVNRISQQRQSPSQGWETTSGPGRRTTVDSPAMPSTSPPRAHHCTRGVLHREGPSGTIEVFSKIESRGPPSRRVATTWRHTRRSATSRRTWSIRRRLIGSNLRSALSSTNTT